MIKSRLVYLAGPVDGVDGNEAKQWREHASSRLYESNIATFSPVGALSTPLAARQNPSIAGRIREINQRALEFSDVVLANLDPPSFGTPIECVETRRRTYAFGSAATVERMRGSVYQHLFEIITTSLDEAITALLRREIESHVAENLSAVAARID